MALSNNIADREHQKFIESCQGTAIKVVDLSYLYQIAEGKIENAEPWSKIGYNGDVDVGTEDMIPQGGVYTFPTAAQLMDITSSDPEDDCSKSRYKSWYGNTYCNTILFNN